MRRNTRDDGNPGHARGDVAPLVDFDHCGQRSGVM
jgi:hypothetical protein